MNWFQTYTGRVIDLEAHPREWPIVIEDIAHALSLICRWSGHVKKFYSVAQHSFLMSCQVNDPERSLALLLHDASEAYLNDVISPLKRRLREGGRPSRYDIMEKKCQEVIAEKFGLVKGAFETEEVKLCDLRMLMTEYRDLLPPFHDPESLPMSVTGWPKTMAAPFLFEISPYDPDYAEDLFLARFRRFREISKLMPEKKGP